MKPARNAVSVTPTEKPTKLSLAKGDPLDQPMVIAEATASPWRSVPLLRPTYTTFSVGPRSPTARAKLMTGPSNVA